MTFLFNNNLAFRDVERSDPGRRDRTRNAGCCFSHRDQIASLEDQHLDELVTRSLSNASTMADQLAFAALHVSRGADGEHSQLAGAIRELWADRGDDSGRDSAPLTSRRS